MLYAKTHIIPKKLADAKMSALLISGADIVAPTVIKIIAAH